MNHKRLLKRKGPRPPPNVRTPNRAQPIQNNTRTTKTPPPPNPRTPQRHRSRTRTPRPLFSPRPCAGGQHRTKQNPRTAPKPSNINHPALSAEGGIQPSRIQHHCAKQTQCQNGQNAHKSSKNKGLCQRTTNNDQRPLSKTNPIKPNSPAPRERPLQFPSRPEQAARRGSQAPNNQKPRRIAQQTDHQQSKLLIERAKNSWLSDVFALE